MEVFYEQGLLDRAISAFYRTRKPNEQYEQPSNLSYCSEDDGKKYVVLKNGKILAVYRVKNDGYLKRLKRWPKAIDEQHYDLYHRQAKGEDQMDSERKVLIKKVDRMIKDREEMLKEKDALIEEYKKAGLEIPATLKAL